MVRNLDPGKRAHYLDCALKLFVSKGVMNTTTAEIAKEAGTAAGTLFLYFPTKQNLLDELILKIGKEQSEYVIRRLNPSLSARETIQIIWHSTIKFFMENMQAYHYLQQVRDTGLISAQAVQESLKYFTYYFEAIQKGLVEGSIKVYPISLIGDILYQVIVAVMNNIRLQPDAAKHVEFIEQGFDIYWNGIRTR